MAHETLLQTLATVIAQPRGKEFCVECGAITQQGEHVWRDLDGVEHPACDGHDRAAAHAYGLRQFIGMGEENAGMRRAKGYRVR